MTMSLTPQMEAIQIPGQISGTGIIDDLSKRIAAKLAQSCDLRTTDCYSGYSAQVQIILQLHDVYPVEVSAQVAVGNIDAQKPVQRVTLGAEVEAPDESGNLERPVDPAGAETPRTKWRAY